MYTPGKMRDVCVCVSVCVTGTNRISHAIQGAHEGSIFALCMLRNGTLVSGGKDRRLISWDGNYQQIQTVEVSDLGQHVPHHSGLLSGDF